MACHRCQRLERDERLVRDELDETHKALRLLLTPDERRTLADHAQELSERLDLIERERFQLARGLM